MVLYAPCTFRGSLSRDIGVVREIRNVSELARQMCNYASIMNLDRHPASATLPLFDD